MPRGTLAIIEGRIFRCCESASWGVNGERVGRNAMYKREISYTLDGDTFVGRYRVSEHEHIRSVSVQFEQQALSARLGDLPEEMLARMLLGELVRAKVAGENPLRELAA